MRGAREGANEQLAGEAGQKSGRRRMLCMPCAINNAACTVPYAGKHRLLSSPRHSPMPS